MFKAILFDADGMVISSPRFSTQLEKQYGIPWSRMEPFFKGPFQACKTSKADLREELGRVIQDWGWKGTVDELMTFWFNSGLILNQDMVELIRTLRNAGTYCYLTSNQETYRGAFLRTHLGLDKLFDGLFFSANLGYTKNESAFFEEVYRALQVTQPELEKGQVAFADDHEENIATAKAFGFQTHLYQNLPAFREFVTKQSE